MKFLTTGGNYHDNKAKHDFSFDNNMYNIIMNTEALKYTPQYKGLIMNKEFKKQLINILNTINEDLNKTVDNLNEDTAQPSNFIDLKKKIKKLKNGIK